MPRTRDFLSVAIWRGVLFAVAHFALAALTAAQAAESCTEPRPNQEVDGSCTYEPGTKTTTCKITKPVVTQSMTEYDGTFHPHVFEAYCKDAVLRRDGIQIPGIGRPPLGNELACPQGPANITGDP